MDITQIVLLSVIIVLTIFLAILGFQVFFVLRDLRSTLKRMNLLFDDANELLEEVKKPIAKAGSLLTALTAGAGIVRLLKRGEEDDRPRKR